MMQNWNTNGVTEYTLDNSQCVYRYADIPNLIQTVQTKFSGPFPNLAFSHYATWHTLILVLGAFFGNVNSTFRKDYSLPVPGRVTLWHYEYAHGNRSNSGIFIFIHF